MSGRHAASLAGLTVVSAWRRSVASERGEGKAGIVPRAPERLVKGDSNQGRPLMR